jgi:signal transduction histidine kinase
LQETQRLADSRERLVRGITHDLKNPLGAADGYAQLLRDGVEGPLPQAQARMVERIIRCHATALALIEDLLDFSRAEYGEVVLAVGPTDCAAIVYEAVDAYAGAARAAGHDIRLHPPGEPLLCVTDHERVVRIVGNLLSNAIKYTPAPGVVTVAARAVAHGPGPGDGPGVEVEVSDTGPGIPPAERTRIFEEFVRLDTTGRSGHGLGLATSLRIARRLGGEITVGDAPAGGASFRLWLPRAPATSPHLPGG